MAEAEKTSSCVCGLHDVAQPGEGDKKLGDIVAPPGEGGMPLRRPISTIKDN